MNNKYFSFTKGKGSIVYESNNNNIITQNASASASASASSTGYNCFDTQKLSETLVINLINNSLNNITNTDNKVKKGKVNIELITDFSEFIEEEFNTLLTIFDIFDVTEDPTPWTIIQTNHSFYKNYPTNTLLSTFGMKNTNTTFGLPIFRFNKDDKVSFKFVNETNNMYTFNIHWHGMNLNAFNDGSSMECIFGEGTKIGTTLDLNINVKNNSALTFYHPHNMFVTSPFIYLGLFGMTLITDKESINVDKYFNYGDNYLVLGVGDIVYNNQGEIDSSIIYDYLWRGNYSHVNGISCVGWNGSENNENYINRLYHNVSNKINLIKITLLNNSCSWRIYNLGVCDKNKSIKFFYFIESDQAYRNPLYTNIISFSPGSRVSIIFDLNDFLDNEAYLFFYSFDLTENNGLVYNTDISEQLLNPIENTNPQKYQIYPNGIEPKPENYLKLRFLKISYKDTQAKKNNIPLTEVITKIKKLVFGKNYELVEKLPLPVEKNNYGKYLNTNYFYNLPDFINDIPERQHLLFYDITDSKVNGSTEYISDGQNRIFSDMWNSYEYDMYLKTKDNYFLPSCLFSISKYTGNYLKYSNYQMQDNHLLIIKIYNSQKPDKLIDSVTISFPESNKPLNIDKWTKLVNSMYSKTFFKDENNQHKKISEILEYNWEPYLYKFTYLRNKATIIPYGKEFYNPITNIKTVRIKNINKSDKYIIELEATWSLLNFYGKPFAAMQMPMPMPMHVNHDVEHVHDEHCCNNHDVEHVHDEHCCTHDNHHSMNNLQTIYTMGGSRNGKIEKPTAKGNFILKIYNNETYLGFPDGYNNDNFRNISIKKNSCEKWRYNNGDTQNWHPFHFHMTSGYILNEDNKNNPLLMSKLINFLYYSKDNINIPPQNYITMRIKFPNYTSLDGPIPYLGFMYHCHFMAHHDMNMISQFFVYDNKNDFFPSLHI